jgi:hypothetical protein
MNAPMRKVGGWQVHPLTRENQPPCGVSALNTPPPLPT